MRGATELRPRRPVRPGRRRAGWTQGTTIDPRFYARRRAVRRRLSLRRRVLLGALGAVVVLAALAWPLSHTSLLSAKVVTVTGAAHTGDAAVLSASGLAGHPPMVDVDAGQAVRRIEALPWVATATVSLDWPDGVRVRVRERTAVAVVADGAGWGELDRTGRVLATAPTPPAGLPHLVSGPKPGQPGTTLAGARPSLAVAAALPVAFGFLVTAVSRSPGGGVDLALSDGIGVVLGAPSELPAKFEDVASLLAGAGLSPGSVIDVSVPDTPLVAPPAGSPPAG